VAATPSPQIELTQRDLSRWRLVQDFKVRLAQVASRSTLPSTWSNPQRLLALSDYLGLFLLGLINPVVRTMRGLCAASSLAKVQAQICTHPVSLGSFSEAQAVLDPALLAEVFSELSQELSARQSPPQPGQRHWLIQDGSLFDALPRMYWALWRRQNKVQAQVRLHLSLDLKSQSPARAVITPGKTCERAAWQSVWQPGDAYVGDRYYSENYQFFGQMDQRGIAFVTRLLEAAVFQVEEELPLTEADRQANVLRSAWGYLGCKEKYRSIRVRVVWVQTEKEVLRLVTNLKPEELSAGEVALLYRERWKIELFFRWVKCILGCRHWLAESPQGVGIELYLALIAALLLQLYTGEAPTRRIMEMIQFYMLGIASLDELWAAVARERTRRARIKKS
jgi:hypothetical protein